MTLREGDDLQGYAAKLRHYSTEELRDIYRHIHILRHPVRYKLLLRELEARGVTREHLVPVAPRSEILERLNTIPLFARYGGLRALAAGVSLLFVAAAVTFAMLLPIWLFEQPLDFRGIEPAIVYVVYAPAAPFMGVSLGVKIGGRGSYFLWVLAGVVLALWLFSLTGVPADIWKSVTEPHGSGAGFNIGGF
jgi:hypothetical protein